MNFESVTQIKVGLCFGEDTVPVARLAKRDHKIYFEYDPSFIDQELGISPVKCPLRPGVQSFDPFLFEGLPGVFNDNLPDGWGRLLLDRKMQSLGVMPDQISPLDRLAYVGHTGMGALVYEPDHTEEIVGESINLDTLATHAEQVLVGEASDVLQELLMLNGSSAGARPKAMIGVHQNRQDIVHGTHQLPADYQPWLVKFSNVNDGLDAGAIEYVYALMAVDAGLEMEETMLFPAQKGAGYFATRRFDRRDGMRLHSHTACGLLHSDFRTPSLDYEDLIALTMILTKDIREAEKMYRLAVLNVLSHNRDDHAKNFSFLMDRTGEWKLSPAYDLTFSSGPRGEQSTMVMGQGKNPSISDLVKLGLEAKLLKQTINDILEQTKAALTKWRTLAKEHDVSQTNIDLIAGKITAADA
ncbi:MAG: type II toxin-antitoxin system HipA family toxin [Alphaproteobacteria bacterium]|nr:type II toxin-antitoxin system HipA family toxin [Alphaproteobacteria bacterium]